MRTYYRGPDALLTDEHFVWRTPTSTRIFAVGELRDVGLVRGEGIAATPGAMIVSAIGLVTLTVASWSLVGPAVGYAAAALAVVIAMIVVTSGRRRAARTWRLQATYRGLSVTLYSSADLQRFNQVARALRRAIEVSRQDGPVGRLTPA